jgi:hypothetical protein
MWITASTELLELIDYIFKRCRGIDFDRCGCPKQRLDLCEAAKNHLSFGGALPVWVIGACLDPREQQIDWPLVRLAPSNEEAPADVAPEQPACPVLLPHPVS